MVHRTSPQIGGGGHFTIGGLGPLARQFETALDRVLEADVVLADGSIVRCSEAKNSGLFGMIRGAGSGFGIVTEFVAQHREPASGTAVQYEYSIKADVAKSLAALYKQWQAYVSNPDLTWKLASTLWAFPDSMVITGIYFGTQEEYDAQNMAGQFPGSNGSAVVFDDCLGLVAHLGEKLGLELVRGHSI